MFVASCSTAGERAALECPGGFDLSGACVSLDQPRVEALRATQQRKGNPQTLGTVLTQDDTKYIMDIVGYLENKHYACDVYEIKAVRPVDSPPFFIVHGHLVVRSQIAEEWDVYACGSLHRYEIEGSEGKLRLFCSVDTTRRRCFS